MIGPDGYGDAHFIPPNQVLEYTIRFENDPNATAPAQIVIVSHVLDTDLDVRTFRLGSFGFGSYSRDLMFSTGSLQVSWMLKVYIILCTIEYAFSIRKYLT